MVFLNKESGSLYIEMEDETIVLSAVQSEIISMLYTMEAPRATPGIEIMSMLFIMHFKIKVCCICIEIHYVYYIRVFILVSIRKILQAPNRLFMYFGVTCLS